MAGRILVGPLLGLESDTGYTVCFLADPDSAPQVLVDGKPTQTDQVARTPSGVFWRAAFSVALEGTGQFHTYEITRAASPLTDNHGRAKWDFWVPGNNTQPRIAYASCNGFSSGDAKTKLEDPYAMWTKMVQDHQSEPFALLIMGGDQLYADEIWHSERRVPSIAEFSRLDRKEKANEPATAAMWTQLDAFYEGLYLRHWNQPRCR